MSVEAIPLVQALHLSVVWCARGVDGISIAQIIDKAKRLPHSETGNTQESACMFGISGIGSANDLRHR